MLCPLKIQSILFYLNHNPNASPKQDTKKINIKSSIPISLKFFNICDFNPIKIHHINFKITPKINNTQYKYIFFLSSSIRNVGIIVQRFHRHNSTHDLTRIFTPFTSSLNHSFMFMFYCYIIIFYLILLKEKKSGPFLYTKQQKKS